MRLTNMMRDAFIADVMRRVPQQDYVGQIVNVVKADAVEQLPAAVEELWASTQFREYVHTEYFHTGYTGISSVSVPCSGRGSFHLMPHAKEEVARLVKLKVAQEQKLSSLRSRLKGVAYGCNTLAQLQEALPEFRKWMPEDEGKAVRSLPVVQGVFEEFKRAGWRAA